MKALSLTQPWATLVALGKKMIETRSWSTEYRGPVAIHAAKGVGPGGLAAFRKRCWNAPFFEALEPTLAERAFVLHRELGADKVYGTDGSETGYKNGPADSLPRGAVVAVARLAHVLPTYHPDVDGCLQFSDIWDDDDEVVERLTADGWWLDMGIPVAHWPQMKFGDFTEGRFAWMLEDVVPLATPIPCKGALGLWNVPEELLGQLPGPGFDRDAPSLFEQARV